MSRQNILVVDDEPLIVQSIKDFLMLKRDRYKVSLAYNGVEALDVLGKEKVDLIILDLNMPVLDGIQFLTEIYNRKIWLPVIILTKVITVVSDENSNIFGDFGIVDYMEKPINFNRLGQRIEEVLNHFQVVKKSDSSIDIPKILRFVKMEKRTGILTLKYKQNKGRIFFREGEVVDAEFQNFSPEKTLEEFLKPSEAEKKLSIEYINHQREKKIDESFTEMLLNSL